MKYDLATSTEELGICGVDVVKVLSAVLARMIEQGMNGQCCNPAAQKQLTKFQSSSVPGISIYDYLQRISSYAKCSDSCFIISLIYIDRLIEARGVTLNTLNIHRLLITSVLVAAKMSEDEYFNNSFYARLGGVSVAELNTLELEFVKLLGFSTHVDVATFNRYFNEFWKLDDTCPSRHMPLYLEAAEVKPMLHAGGTVYSAQECQGPVCNGTEPSSQGVTTTHPAPIIGSAGFFVVPEPRPTRAIRFPMPSEYYPAVVDPSAAITVENSGGYVHAQHGVQQGCHGTTIYPTGNDVTHAPVTAHPRPVAAALARSSCDGHPGILKVQIGDCNGGWEPYGNSGGAVNFGMGYARSDAAGFDAASVSASRSPYSVSSKMSPFERRTEEP